MRRLFGAAAMLVAATAIAPTGFAAPSQSPEPKTTVTEAIPAPKADGRSALKAQMNALLGGLENLRRLREFFDRSDLAEDGILNRAQQLIGTLPQSENAEDAAWRIAAVASLTMESGSIAEVDVDDGYRLADGALGWDLGPDGSQVHTGFTPVTPEALTAGEQVSAISGSTALTDGITAVNSFEASLPNGLYRVMIVRDAGASDDPLENPFGGGITLNGSPIRSIAAGERNRVKLTSGGEKVASSGETTVRQTALGLGVEGWAIVEDGQLRVNFDGLPEGSAISAVIAEPFEIDRVDLNPAVMEALARSLGDIETAAGPESRAPRQRVMRFVSRGSATSSSQDGRGSGKTATQNGAPESQSDNLAASRNSFAATRNANFETAQGDDEQDRNGDETQTAQQNALTAPETTDTDNDDKPAFEDRQILVKRSATEGPDTEGLAVDLGASLDDASPSDVFMCLSELCETIPAIAPEPDLSGATELLGDWLGDPTDLPTGWDALETVLAGRETGSEVAMVYEFAIGTDSWTDVELRASSGGGLFVWLDGEYIFGVSEPGEFTDDRVFEYSIELPDIAGGQHFLQILSESHDGTEGFSFELRGTPVVNASLAATSVPEPGTLTLFAVALAGLATLRFRRTH